MRPRGHLTPCPPPAAYSPHKNARHDARPTVARENTDRTSTSESVHEVEGSGSRTRSRLESPSDRPYSTIGKVEPAISLHRPPLKVSGHRPREYRQDHGDILGVASAWFGCGGRRSLPIGAKEWQNGQEEERRQRKVRPG